MPQSIVSFHVLHYPKDALWEGFRKFALLQQRSAKIPGTLFCKVMGCGRGRVFSVRPDWSRYAFLFHWQNAETAKAFFEAKHWKSLTAATDDQKHWLLVPRHSKGLWDGKERFQPIAQTPNLPDDRMAVITRADLKPWRLRSFGKHARQATEALENHPDSLYTLGMGELPFVRQATFSVWDSAAAMKAYAYKDPAHKQAMKGKVTEGWYGEEMYARFGVLRQMENEPATALFQSLAV